MQNNKFIFLVFVLAMRLKRVLKSLSKDSDYQNKKSYHRFLMDFIVHFLATNIVANRVTIVASKDIFLF